MSRTKMKVLGCVLCVAVLGGACGGDEGSSTTPTTVAYKIDEGVGSPAASLRANLTRLFQEHVLLVTTVTDAQLKGQDTGPATAVLDQNATDLGSAIASVYDADVAAAFLDPWRRHTAGLAAFASVAASTDKAVVDQAKADLTAIQVTIANAVNTANPQLTVEVLKESFAAYATATEAAITAQAKNDGTAPEKTKKAADTMSDTAIVFAAGIIKQKKDAVPGKLDAIGAVMRTELTAKLQEHVYLAGIVTGTALGAGDVAPASETLDENSLELSRAIGAVYGDEAARRFLELWRQHIEFFVDFTVAAGSNDTTKMDAARSALDGYRATFAAFLNDANPKLSEAAVANDLGEHIDSLLIAIEAQAGKEPGQVAKLREAAMHMPTTALLLATGIAQQFPTKFG